MKGRKSKAAAGTGRQTADDPGVVLQRYPHLTALALIVPFAAFLHANLIPLVADGDSFYHLRHSWVYRTQGLFDSSFPWAQCSAIKTYAADIWYGFHILTVPFSLFDPLLDGIYWAAFTITVVSLGLIFTALRTLGVRWPLLWLFFIPLMSSDLMYRLTMMRPHPLSLGLVLLVFSFLVKPKSRSTLAAIFLIGALQAWLHIALLWLPVFVAGTVSLVRIVHRRPPDLDRLAALGAGITIGVFLRPNPIGAVHLAYIQVVKLMLEKADVHLHVGVELLPFYAINFYDQFVPLSILLVLGVVALGVLIRNRQLTAMPVEARIAVWSSLTIAVVFFILSFEVARRSHEIFVGFSAIFLALLAGRWRWSTDHSAPTKLAMALALVTLVAGPMWALYRYPILTFDTASDPRRLKDVGEWLGQHAEPGEIVFHPQWDNFGFLFFWNPRNYYINGMDPIFEYAYDPTLYWKTHYLHNGAADEVTCGAYPCVDEVISTYESLKRDFHAAYITVETQLLPGLSQYLARTPQFTKVFESPTGAVVYRIN